VLLATPVALAIAGVGFEIKLWLCPVLCAALAAGITYSQHVLDRASGLVTVLACCPVRGSDILKAKVVAAAAIFIAQMAIFAGLHAILPGGGF